MEDPSLKQEMSLKTFLYCLKHLKTIGDDKVRILWWEPLLYSKIEEIFKLSVKWGFRVHTFSNFKIPVPRLEKILDFGDSYDYSRLSFNLNLNDEDFYKQGELDMIYNTLQFLREKWCSRMVSYNIYEYSHAYDFIFDVAQRFGVKDIILKVTNTVMWDKEIIDSNSREYW